MKEELISLETAKLAKEKGFKLYCACSYWGDELSNLTPGYALDNGETSADNYYKFERYYAPRQSLLQKWLREIHNIDISIIPIVGDLYDWYIYSDLVEEEGEEDGQFQTYESALESALYEALKLI